MAGRGKMSEPNPSKDLIPFLDLKCTIEVKKGWPEQKGELYIGFSVPRSIRICRQNSKGESVFLMYTVEENKNQEKRQPFPGLRAGFRYGNNYEFLKPYIPLNLTTEVVTDGRRNEIRCFWNSKLSRLLTFYILVGKPLSPHDLLLPLVKSRVSKSRPWDSCIKTESTGDVCEIESNEQVLSLNCPLGRTRITEPCKSINCKHIQCFDALAYLSLNQKNPKWTCPICSHAAGYDTLIIDQFVKDILQQTSSECTSVLISDDGTWTSVTNGNTGKRKSKDIVVIDLTEDDDNEKPQPCSKRIKRDSPPHKSYGGSKRKVRHRQGVRRSARTHSKRGESWQAPVVNACQFNPPPLVQYPPPPPNFQNNTCYLNHFLHDIFNRFNHNPFNWQ